MPNYVGTAKIYNASCDVKNPARVRAGRKGFSRLKKRLIAQIKTPAVVTKAKPLARKPVHVATKKPAPVATVKTATKRRASPCQLPVTKVPKPEPKVLPLPPTAPHVHDTLRQQYLEFRESVRAWEDECVRRITLLERQ